jgi:two-component system nitrogen regulation response regulator NtrX
MARILIVDDEEQIRASLKGALERREHEVVTAESLAEGREFSRAGFDLIFLDIMLPDGSGLDLLKELLLQDSRQLIVMISGHADIQTAVDAIKSGAYDFIEKPISLDRVLITVDNASRAKSLLFEKERLTDALYGEFIGESSAVVHLKDNIIRSADKTTRFLILGENGTGKELVANMIHRNSRFSSGPFVAVNCAALPADLVESELFGHVAGAFTGAGKARKGRFVEADRGTIFLDEISEMSPDAQAKILRVVEYKAITPVGSDKTVSVDCNIIAASNRDLASMVTDGTFRQDLLYRLNVVQFQLPPLRERRGDIPLLVDYFLGKFSRETKTPVKKLAPEALSYLRSLKYPGNIRELKNLVERLNIYCTDDTVRLTDVKVLMPSYGTSAAQSLKEAVGAFEQEYIEAAIARNDGNMAQAARELGLERSHLYKKVRKFN